MKYIGRDNTKVLFSLDNVGVLVDELTKAVDIFPNVQTLLASGEWDPSFAPKEITMELAEAAYVDLDIEVVAAIKVSPDRSRCFLNLFISGEPRTSDKRNCRLEIFASFKLIVQKFV
jgi:hypothetical protein